MKWLCICGMVMTFMGPFCFSERCEAAVTIPMDVRIVADRLKAEAQYRMNRQKAIEDTKNKLVVLQKQKQSLDKMASSSVKQETLSRAYADNKRDMEYQQKNLEEYLNVGKALKRRNYKYLGIASKLYTWKTDSSNVNKGHQFYQSVNANSVKGLFDFGIHLGGVLSDYSSMSQGRVNSLLDTYLNVTYTHQLDNDNQFLYMMGFNVPTGKNKLYNYAPVMSDDLVENSRFGAGFNVVPGIYYYRWLNGKNQLGIGGYAALAGAYDYRYGDSEDRLNPGNSYVGELQWKHLDRKLQTLVSLSCTDYSSYDEVVRDSDGKDLGSYYKPGIRLLPRATINYSPDAKNMFTVYYWHEHNAPLREFRHHLYPEMVNPSSTGKIRNFGVQWSRKITPKTALRFYYDRLWRSGNIYDPLMVAPEHRQKHTFGVGYDVFKNSQEKMSLSMEAFRMQDRGKEKINYKGLNFYASYSKYF